MNFDTLIAGGTLHTEDAALAADIAITGGRIAAVTLPGVIPASAAGRVIDAGGCEVFPGFLDVHVHLALPFCGTVSCDDFDAGSKAAACGGVTTVIDFAIPGKGQTLRQAHEAWEQKAAGRSIVDYAWHLAITDDRHLEEIPRMIEAGLPTFKQFMIYESEGWNSDDARMFKTLGLLRRHGGVLLVHAESSRLLDGLIREQRTPERMRELGAKLHALTRPNIVEAEAIARSVRLCEETGGQLYIVHMSTGEGADIVRSALARGVPVAAETCVQYLVLDDRVFDRDDGHLFACCPQVKKPADIDRLWRGLGEEVCLVSTDTCSFTREQKAMWKGDFTKIPMGLPGLDTMIPLLYTLGVKARRITPQQLVGLCAGEPARKMGLWGRKGAIAPGFDADITIIDPRASKTVTPRKTLQSMCDWSPYEGMNLAGFSRTTLVRGTVVVDGGEPVARPGHGVFLPRVAPVWKPNRAINESPSGGPGGAVVRERAASGTSAPRRAGSRSRA